MSNQNFKNTRVTTSKAVLMKNGQAVCLAFANPNNKPADPSKNRSSETTSFSSDTFKIRNNLHAGMTRKPLEKYHPNAQRSRLSSPTVVMPYKNSSQIVIGDRSSYYKRQFVSTSTNTFAKPNHVLTSNPGIVAEATKKQKNAANQ